MEKKELLKEISNTCYDELQNQIKSYCEIYSELAKVKGTIAARKTLRKFATVGDLTIITTPYNSEEKDMRDLQSQLDCVKENIQNGVEKIKLIKSLMNTGKKKKK
jgi:hypothetical protein